MILADFQIRERFSEFIPSASQRDESLINPASFDVRIGSEIKGEIMRYGDVPGRICRTVKGRPENFGDTVVLQHDETFWLDPGEIILVSMLEHIHVPTDMTMSFYLKSSRAREGYEHANAGWIDPGWNGVLTMEIKNNLRYNTIPIYTGLRIGQLKVEKLDRVTSPYSGRYQHASTVEAAK